ncbi:MAG: efflux RND transporter periplasmic adaptor subunit [Anaerolineales bacterium]
MNLGRIIIGAFVVIVIVIAGTIGYQQFLAPVEPTPTPQPVEPAEVPINAEGRVVPQRQASLASELAGRVVAIEVEEGDYVEQDDLLIELDKESLEAQLDQAQAALEAALAQQEMLPSRASDEEEDLAQAQVDQARAALREAQSALNRSQLRAPLSGRVISIDTTEGEVAAAGMPVILLADTSQWRVETLDVLEEDAVHLRLGQSVDVEFAAFPDEQVTGWIEEMALNATSYQGNVTYTVTIGLPSGLDLDLNWGMTAFVTMNRFPPLRADEPARAPGRTATQDTLEATAETGEGTAEPSSTASLTPTPTRTQAPTPSSTTASSTIHVVQEDENLFRISLNYGVSVEAIREANDLEDNLIYVGQRLVIPSAEIE